MDEDYRCHFCGEIDREGGSPEDWEDWDAFLCRACSAAQREAVQATVGMTLEDIFPGLKVTT